jgi:inhibitor of KinA
MTLRLLHAGDAAFTLELGHAIDAGLLSQVQALDAAIALAHDQGRLPGLIETVPTFRSLTVFFDPCVSSRQTLLAALKPLLDKVPAPKPSRGRCWRLPVCYEGGPDLAATAQAIGASEDEVVALHTATEVRVYMLGFLPGFAFMGDVHERLQLPRRTEPRLRVPAGSVAVAGGLTAVYPWESPGGWHLLGRCPVPLFDSARSAPSLLSPGDRVRFEAVTSVQCHALEEELRNRSIDPRRWLLEGPGTA